MMQAFDRWELRALVSIQRKGDFHTDAALFDKPTNDCAAACNLSDPAQVPDFYLAAGRIGINRGDDQHRPAAMVAMANSFTADFPDPKLTHDFFRAASDHDVNGWTLERHHAETATMYAPADGKNGI